MSNSKLISQNLAVLPAAVSLVALLGGALLRAQVPTGFQPLSSEERSWFAELEKRTWKSDVTYLSFSLSPKGQIGQPTLRRWRRDTHQIACETWASSDVRELVGRLSKEQLLSGDLGPLDDSAQDVIDRILRSRPYQAHVFDGFRYARFDYERDRKTGQTWKVTKVMAQDVFQIQPDFLVVLGFVPHAGWAGSRAVGGRLFGRTARSSSGCTTLELAQASGTETFGYYRVEMFEEQAGIRDFVWEKRLVESNKAVEKSMCCRTRMSHPWSPGMDLRKPVVIRSSATYPGKRYADNFEVIVRSSRLSGENARHIGDLETHPTLGVKVATEHVQDEVTMLDVPDIREPEGLGRVELSIAGACLAAFFVLIIRRRRGAIHAAA